MLFPRNSSISIACWIVVFTPQIHSNFRRRSADGLSLLFIIVWLVGDIFNIIGAVLQKVLPTMIILAVYYTLADLVLLAQCLWYRRRVEGGDERVVEEREEEEEQEEEDTRPLLQREPESPRKYSAVDADGRGRKGSRNGSFSSLQTRLAGLDASRLSRSSPYAGSRRPSQAVAGQKIIKVEPTASSSTAAAVLSNISALALVTLAGVLGWYLSSRSHQFPDSDDDHHVDPISPSPSIFTTTIVLRLHLVILHRSANFLPLGPNLRLPLRPPLPPLAPPTDPPQRTPEIRRGAFDFVFLVCVFGQYHVCGEYFCL